MVEVVSNILFFFGGKGSNWTVGLNLSDYSVVYVVVVFVFEMATAIIFIFH